jgi:hypothetical protein
MSIANGPRTPHPSAAVVINFVTLWIAALSIKPA